MHSRTGSDGTVPPRAMPAGSAPGCGQQAIGPALPGGPSVDRIDAMAEPIARGRWHHTGHQRQ